MFGLRHQPITKLIILDIAVTIFIYMILTCMAVIMLSEFRKLAANSAGPIEAVGLLKTDVATYYALHGEWPKDMAALQTLFPENRKIYEGYKHGLKSYDISNGAINTTFNKDKRVITIHPAVTSDDPLGTVIWVAGNRSRKDGWNIIGEDRTTVEERYISRYLK